MDLFESLQLRINQARNAWHVERTAQAHGRLVSAQGDLAVARALLDCGYRPLPDGRFERVEATT
jgi:ketosteroid isomerase-like protein